MNSPPQNADEPQEALFYGAPQPLSSVAHRDWRLKDGDVTFAAETAFVPIVIGELAAAARCYPIVFAAGGAQPVAVLGLERLNLFVADGSWAQDSYLPAYVRRYPFGFMATSNSPGFALAIDAASDRVVRSGDQGTALFEGVEPSALTKQAMAFCDAFHGEASATKAFADALQAQDLLIDRRADATLPDGRKLGLDGFQIVDADRLSALADEVVLDWHKRGWLALAYFHLHSLERFSHLLARHAARAASTIETSEAAHETAGLPLHDQSPEPKKA